MANSVILVLWRPSGYSGKYCIKDIQKLYLKSSSLTFTTPMETICMKCQILFTGEKQEYHQFAVL